MKDIFITATDTGVGKSVISLLIMNYIYKKFNAPAYLKIFQTGCEDLFDHESDAHFVYKNVLDKTTKDFLKDKVCYLFKNPKAPYYAALDENVEINIPYVLKWIDQKREKYSPIVFEGAGGLLVPITEKFFIIDLIQKLDVEVILVSRPYLGTINHTLLSIEALKNRNIEVKAVIFSNQDRNFMDKDLIYENINAVSKLGSVKTFFLDYIFDIKKEKDNYLSLIEKILISN